MTTVEEASSTALLAALRDRGAGEVIAEADGRYKAARRVWNGAIDRRPLAVVRCAAPTQVAATIAVARTRGVPLAVRGGGHSLPGFSTCDGGIVLDLSPMRHVTVDPAARRAIASGGCTWADFDQHTQQHDLASTGGLVSTTGVAGLTLGGGIGWLTRAQTRPSVSIAAFPRRTSTAPRPRARSLSWSESASLMRSPEGHSRTISARSR